MSPDADDLRSDALARANSLAARARGLRRAQAEVQAMTSREVQVLARTAASFFDAIPMAEFTPALLPQSARGLRRIRHRILHRTIHTTVTGTLIRALLLGRDGALRLFSARSPDSRDLLLILEPGRVLPVGVMRDVVDWTPMLRVPGFRPFEILEKLSNSLDAVEEQIKVAEARVQVQKAALASGDLAALLPSHPTESVTSSAPREGARTRADAAAIDDRSASAAHASVPPVTSSIPATGRSEPVPRTRRTPLASPPVAAARATPVATPSAPAPAMSPSQFLDVFELVEQAAAAAEVKGTRSPTPLRQVPVASGSVPAPATPLSDAQRFAFDAESHEWDDPPPATSAARTS